MTQSLFSDFQPIAAIATTNQAALTLKTLCLQIGSDLHLPSSLESLEADKIYTHSLKEYLTEIWDKYEAIIFALATGAVVRLIAPFLSNKATDPAIIVIDPQGKWVISLCGGHQGGGDRLAQLIATVLDATPILTGASQALNLPGIDTLGETFGWQKGAGDWTGLSAAIANQKTIQVIQEAGSKLWQKALPADHSFLFENTHTVDHLNGKIWISAYKSPSNSACPQIEWHPRVLWVGIGCVRGTPQALISQAITQVFEQFNLSPSAIAAISSINIKSDEIGLIDFCESHNLPLMFFTADQLNQVGVPNPSVIVEQEVGTPSVAEASALLASQNYGNTKLLVPKQVIKQGSDAVTVAIALSEQEYTGKIGTLWLVGTGPGALEQITSAAKMAIVQADVIIGYSLYLDLIKSLKRAGQIIESFPLTQERQRCQRAIELAKMGLKVAVVSSGDCGIYGMAGLVLEELQKQDWDGQNPLVEVFPGITALQAAAAQLGAPLMHDFCAISLSDLLTPKEKILKRLEAAAIADFVTALYNPKSQKRTELITLTQGIFLQHRSPETPVALVRSVYREDQVIVKTTLMKMLDFPIDMLTVILIGNSTTYFYEDCMITPRGY